MIGAELLPGLEPDGDFRQTDVAQDFLTSCTGAPDWQCYGAGPGGAPIRLPAGTRVRIIRRSDHGRALVRTLETLEPLWAWLDLERLADPQMELPL